MKAKLTARPLWTYGHNHFSNVGDYQIRSGELLIRQPGFEASSMRRCCLFDASMQGTERKKVRDDPFKRICAAFVTNLYQKRNGSGINFFKVQHSYHSVWKSIEKSHFYNFASEASYVYFQISKFSCLFTFIVQISAVCLHLATNVRI